MEKIEPAFGSEAPAMLLVGTVKEAVFEVVFGRNFGELRVPSNLTSEWMVLAKVPFAGFPVLKLPADLPHP